MVPDPNKSLSFVWDYYNHTTGLYYAADIEYLGKAHLPYACFVLCAFVGTPVSLLALYPFGFFQQLLNLLPPLRWYVLHTFMDSFQGCYKDGTEPGMQDCRWFSSLSFVCRFALFAVYASTLNVVFGAAAILLLIIALLIVVFRPLKSAHYSVIILIVVFILVLAFVSVVSTSIYSCHFTSLRFCSCSLHACTAFQCYLEDQETSLAAE